MMKKEGTANTKKKITLAAVFVGVVLCILTLIFILGVKKQLWEQSINTIMESTKQGCGTLRVQLQNDYKSMSAISKHISKLSKNQEDKVEEILYNYEQTEEGTSLYLSDGTRFPSSTQKDVTAEKALKHNDKDYGMIEPHISSVTGLNVFNQYVKVTMRDGTKGYLLKEYEVENIVDSFSLSFYNDAGFSYVLNSDGNILIRSPHPNSNKTIKNLFDMLPQSKNDPDSLAQFAQSLKDSRTGYAVFTYEGEGMVFCYVPLELQSDWYLISIIPEDVVKAQTNEILKRSLALIGAILLGIFLLVFFYFRHAARANRKLSNQADYIEHLYNAIPEGVALITADRPYRFIQLNQEGLRLLGYPCDAPNDATNGTLVENIVYPDDFEKMLKTFQDAPIGEQKSVFENRLQKTDGSLFWAAGIVEETLDADGRPVLIAAFHDITDEKLAKEEAEKEKLQERITLVRAISNAYPVIIRVNLTKDTLNFTYVKPGLMLKIGEQETYSEFFADMIETIHEDYISDFAIRFSLQSLRETLGQQKNEAFLEAKQMLGDGKYHWTSTQIIHVDNPYSDDKLAILISRRIDEQRYEEEQQRQALQSALDNAEAANEAKSQFLSNMSHDIRTPMNAVVGMTAIAGSHLDDKEKIGECLKKINLSSKHLLSLINDVLDMSKIENGKMSLRTEPFNFAELVADVLEIIQLEAKSKQLKLDINLAMLKNETVSGDPLRVRQVFINILSNAVKYTLACGSIHIEVKQEDSHLKGYQNYVFYCADTGIGMSEEFLKRIFQPFERVQDSTSSKIAGTGLGMAITKNLVDLMNGEIEAESRQGEGSAFTVTLPLQVQGSAQEKVPPEWVGIRGLIVDDNRQMCENAAEIFEDMGLRMEFDIKGEDAVERLKRAKNTSSPFQLAFVGWKRSNRNGAEVIRRIRQAAGPEVIIIILTTYEYTEIEEEAKAAGATTFLSMPIYRSKICCLLRQLSGEETPLEQMMEEKGDYADKRLLLVEDNELNREIARELICEIGIQIEEACDGEDAVAKISQSEDGYYDLVLMDIQMPKLDGYEATKIIRALKRRDVEAMPIIAMTANAFEEDVRMALRAGMNDHFAKPFDMEELKQILYQYLGAAPKA